MATPGAIAVYTAGSGTPDTVQTRPWRGVYHHWDGTPEWLGAHLLERVKAAKGDLAAVTKHLVDDAPYGWSCCFKERKPDEAARSAMDKLLDLFRPRAPAWGEEQYTKEDPGLPVSPQETGAVAFVYAFDLEDRRLDAFATHSGATGERIGSVRFSAQGEADAPALDLVPAERVMEAALKGPTLTAAQLDAFLRALGEVGSPAVKLEWLRVTEAAARSLVVSFRALTYDAEGQLGDVVERDWPLVPAAAREEPERVFACLRALVGLLREHPRLVEPFWLSGLDPLRRSGARQEATFKEVFKALAARDVRE